MLTLRKAGADEGATWALPEGRCVVGRGEDCCFRLDDHRVSRHHAELEVSGGRARIRDLGSGNGVFVNGSRVARATLSPGDRLGLGPVELVLEERPDEPPPPPPPEENEVLVERARVDGAALPSDSRRLQVLYQVAEELVSNLRRADLLSRVLDALADLFRYDRCSIVLRESDGTFVPAASRPEGRKDAFSRTVAERVARDGQALLFDDLQGQASFDLGESVVGLNIRSVLCAPLAVRGEVLGVVYVDRSLPNAYGVEDLAVLQGVAAMVAVALENAQLYAEVEGRYEQTAEQLKVLEARLIETERAAALGQLALAVADAVRNPVMVIGGLARRLGRGGGNGEADPLADTIRGEADRLEETMMRVDALVALPEARVQPADVRETVDLAVAQVRGALQVRRVSLTVDWAGGPLRAPHDPELTRTALAALVRCLCERVPEGGALRLGVAAAGASPPVLVLEDGRCHGCAPELRGVFEARASREPWALDLDLALAERAMVAQGGDVQIGGSLEGGFTGRLVLPARSEPPVGAE